MKEEIVEADLIKGIAEKNPRIIRRVYSLYFNSIVDYVLRNKGAIEDAKDVFQDAMMIIYEKTLDPDFKLQYTLHTYLYTICRNTWLKKLRKKSDMGVPLPEHLELIAEDTFEAEILWQEKEQLYRKKFKELGAGCQQVLQLFFKGTSMEDIAKKMNFSSVGYAKKRKYKCKNQLVKLVQNDQKFKSLTEKQLNYE